MSNRLKKRPAVAGAMDALMKKRTLSARSEGLLSRRRDSLPAPRDLVMTPERGRGTFASPSPTVARAMGALMKKRTLRARSGGIHSTRQDSHLAPRNKVMLPKRGRGTFASPSPTVARAMDALMKKRTLSARSEGLLSRRRDSLPTPRNLVMLPKRGRGTFASPSPTVARAMDERS